MKRFLLLVFILMLPGPVLADGTRTSFSFSISAWDGWGHTPVSYKERYHIKACDHRHDERYEHKHHRGHERRHSTWRHERNRWTPPPGLYRYGRPARITERLVIRPWPYIVRKEIIRYRSW